MKKRFFIAIASCGLFAILFLGLHGMFGRSAGERISHFNNLLSDVRQDLARPQLTRNYLEALSEELEDIIQRAQRGQRWYADTDEGEEFSQLVIDAEELRQKVQQKIDAMPEPIDDDSTDEETDEGIDKQMEDERLLGVDDWSVYFPEENL